MKTLIVIHFLIGLIWGFYSWGYNKQRKLGMATRVCSTAFTLVAWEAVFFFALLLIAHDKGKQWAKEKP